MNNKTSPKRKLLIGAATLIGILILFYLVGTFNRITKVDYAEFARITMIEDKPGFSIYELCQESDSLTYENFPYREYVKAVDYNDLHRISANLTELDSCVGNNFLAQSILSNAFTNESDIFLGTQNLDSLNMILNWADNFKIYAQFTKEGATFYESVYDYWYLFTSKKLEEATNQNPNRKFDFKYRYLSQRCIDNGYLKNEGYSLSEKVFLNIIDQNWPYLFNRFWYATSFMFKSVVFLVLGVSIVFFIFIVKKLF